MGLESLIPPRQKDFGAGQAKKLQGAESPEYHRGAESPEYHRGIVSPKSESVSLPQKNQGGLGSVIRLEDQTWAHKEKEPGPFPKHTESFRADFKNSELKIPSPQPSVKESVFQIEVEKIKPNPYQPRKQFDENGLRELAQSVREFGVIQPVVVSKITRESDYGAEVEYELLAGERRLMAAKIVGLPRIPAIVRNVPRENRREKLELALIENLQRHDLSPIDEARAYARLNEEFGLTQREIAERVGKSREAVANTMRFLGLSWEMQGALISGKINQSQARSLLGIEDLEARKSRFAEFLSVRSVGVVRKNNNLERSRASQTPEEKFWERQLEDKLGAPVKIVRSGGGGKIIVTFYSDEEKSGVLKKIIGEPL